MVRSKKRSTSSSGTRPTSTLATTTTPSSSSVLSSFAPGAAYFALLTQALDRHRLRIYAPQQGAEARLAADYVLPNARATSLVWAELPGAAAAGAEAAGSKKRRKDTTTATTAAAATAPGVSVVALGLSDGTVSLFSPTHARVVRSLSDSTSTTSGSRSILALHFVARSFTLYAACADGLVRTWNLRDKEEDDAPLRTSTEGEEVRSLLALAKGSSSEEVLCASHSISQLGGAEGAQTWTGHASSVQHLLSVGVKEAAFLSAAEADRVLTLWSRASSRPLASLPLDAPARRLHSFTLPNGLTLVLALSESGALALYEVAAALLEGEATPAKRTPTLQARAKVELKLGKKQDLTPLLDAVVVGEQLYVAALVRGAKLVLESTSLLDESGSLPPLIELLRSGGGTAGLLHDGDVALTGGVSSTQRYVEPLGAASRSTGATSSSALGSATGNGLLAQPDDAKDADAQADLDVDLDPDGAEPTLAARLKGLGVSATSRGSTSKSTRSVGLEAESDAESDSTAPLAAPLAGPGGLSNGISLAQTLTQALHSDDGALLSSCLAHSDVALIRESVRRLSGPLAVRLLEAAVVRLGQGQKSKGALGSQSARGLTEWIRCTLAAHTGYLMSLPNLVTKLSTLHSVLSTRLASHDQLLSLSGRLELVLAQIELRTAYTAEAAARAPVQGLKGKRGRAKAVAGAGGKEKKWDEESEDEEEMDVDEDEDEEGDEVDVVRLEGSDDESDDEEEDIALGNQSGAGGTSAESGSEESDEEEEEEVIEEDTEMKDAVSAEEDSEEDDDDEEAEDESELEDDSDEVDDEEDDSDAEKGGLFDLEASEEDEDGSEDDDDE